MYVAQISIGIFKRKHVSTQNETIRWLLECWRNSGQILGREFILVKEDELWETTVGIPARNAFYFKHNSEYAQRVISEEFPRAGLAPVSTQIIGADPPG